LREELRGEAEIMLMDKCGCKFVDKRSAGVRLLNILWANPLFLRRIAIG
jgi:hypothetical protein